jgi:uncharacterized membrane protein YphA (DoxX/SURF4 family)
MNTLTRFFLVLLRLALGWLFLVEGFEKVESVWTGPTETNMPFSSAGYLKESSGPLSRYFLWPMGGDPDDLALEELAVQPVPPGEDPAKVPPHTRISPALRRDFEDYFQRFTAHYGLTEGQLTQAQGKLDQSLDNAVVWLTDSNDKDAKEVTKAADFPNAAFTAKETPVQRVNAYRAKVAEVRQAQGQYLTAFGKDVLRQKLRSLKAEAARMRDELLADLQAPLRESLRDVLTDEQKAKPALPAPEPPALLLWTDFAVRWGLVVVGAGLLLGLFTRLNCLGGALFLVMLYLAMPPWPWLPENLRTEGHYLFVNKNLILALALLALATTRSGAWFGLDGLLHALNPWRRRAAPAHRSPARFGEKVPAHS